MSVYLLYASGPLYSNKVKGIYSSREKAQEARKLISHLSAWIEEEKVQ